MIARTFGIKRGGFPVTSCQATREDTWLMRAARVLSQTSKFFPHGIDTTTQLLPVAVTALSLYPR